MKSKRPVQENLEKASQLAYILENALRAQKADARFCLDKIVKIKEYIKMVEQRVKLEHES